MRLTIRNSAKIALAAAILVAVVVCCNSEALRVRYHLWALRRAERGMFRPANSSGTFVGVLSDSLSRSWEYWSKDRDRHEEALLRLGYLSRQEFPFTNRTLSARQLFTNAQSRFATRMTTMCVLTNGQPLSATSVCARSVVRVTAPRTEEEQWRTLISEFDQKTK